MESKFDYHLEICNIIKKKLSKFEYPIAIEFYVSGIVSRNLQGALCFVDQNNTKVDIMLNDGAYVRDCAKIFLGNDLYTFLYDNFHSKAIYIDTDKSNINKPVTYKEIYSITENDIILLYCGYEIIDCIIT